MSAAVPTVPTTSREQLIYALTEAAEIEHGLMCCYLYAAWSMKRSDELVDPAQGAAVARWRQALVDVAVEEMSHLALVSNLLVAVGARPHLTRPNMPVSLGYHPSSITVELAPFDAATVDHFLFLERPGGSPVEDGKGFAGSSNYRRLEGGVATAFGLTPGAHDYATVGELYRGIGDGLAVLAAEEGEAALFVGDPAHQLGPPLLSLPGMRAVTDLASAQAALATIVEQGEGARADRLDSYYARFGRVKREMAELAAADPAFDPAWPAARNPVLRPPPDPAGRVQLTDPAALRLADTAAAVYGMMLRGLQLSWTTDDPRRAWCIDVAITSMEALSALGETLARAPACADGRTGVNAGFPFTCPRSVGLEWNAADGPALLAERARELISPLRDTAAVAPGLDGFAARLSELADQVRPALRAAPAAGREATPSAAEAAEDAMAASGHPMERAEGRDLDIVFRTRRCIHSRHCVLGAPLTFLANTPGEWIFPDATPTERLIGIAHECPSGAIRYARRDGGAEESAPPVNSMRLRENGPYAVHAELVIAGDPDPGFRATLCRCGASRNKPFCDGSHAEAGFVATGEPLTIRADPLDRRDGPLQVTPLRDGPLALEGAVEICAGTGRVVLRTARVKLCRCGRSGSKPVCDGTHRRVGFRAAGA